MGVTRREILCIVLILADIFLVQTLDDLLLGLTIGSGLGLQIALVILFVCRILEAGVLAMISRIAINSILGWMRIVFKIAGIVTFRVQLV